jgi:hypothetical protein
MTKGGGVNSMGFRRPSPRFQPGQLTSQDANNLNEAMDALYRIVGGFTAIPPLLVSEGSGGVCYSLQGAVTAVTGDGGFTIEISSGGLTVTNAKTLIFNTNDFTATNPGSGQFQVSTNGYTGTFTATSVSDASCSGGTFSKTTKTLTIVIRDGLITTAPTYS